MSDASVAVRALALLDLTDLAEDAGEAGLRSLCERAVAAPGPVAAICIWPRFVRQARVLLGDGPVRIATVVNFPEGGTAIAPVLRETERALTEGADEIDLVLPWQAFLAGFLEPARHGQAGESALRRQAAQGHPGDGEYPDLAQVQAAAELAIAEGADFIKTSTGKTAHSASIPAARTMLQVIGATKRPVGLKPSGGIRSLSDAASYLALTDAMMGPDWATPESFRFGASGLHQVLVDVIAGGAAGQANGPY